MIIFTIIGALVGAGFASGQEIYLFFYRYGTNGIFGIFLFVVISIFVIYKVLKNIILKYKNTQYYHVFLTSAIMLVILGFLNPISNTGCLGIIFVVMPLLMGEIKNEKEVL